MGLLVEMMVSVLLAATIWYCITLDRRLKSFKADESSLRLVIADLTAATMKAETAVPGLRVATAEAEQSLGDKLRRSQDTLAALDLGMRGGEEVLLRIARIIDANREAEAVAIAAAERLKAETIRAIPATDRIERIGDAARAARELALRARERKLAEAA
jgi:hypothetical protein